jgi:hypothetical protein
MMHNLLEASLDLSVATSLRVIPVKYNIINRLWSITLFRHLANLSRATFAVSAHAVALLHEFIWYAYTFYTNLVAEHTPETARVPRRPGAVPEGGGRDGGVVVPPETGAALSGQSLAAISRAPADLALPNSSAPPPPGTTSPNPSQLPAVSQQEDWATTTGACVPYRGGDSADR